MLLSACAPGFLAGALLTGLLYFLNPHLPFAAAPVASGALTYCALLALGSLVCHLPFTWERPRRARVVLPWILTFVLGASSLISWLHASRHSFLLPPGINQRLLKAAVWLSLATVICFYTALVHLLRQRPYGFRSRVLFLALGLATVYVMFERREAFRPRLGPGPRPATVQSAQRPKICVVGLESATLDAILPLSEQGSLPFFARLLEEGSHGRLASIHPTRRAPLWTTLASGRLPYQHGVVGQQTFANSFLGKGRTLTLLPMGLRFDLWGTRDPGRAIDSRSLKVLRLWDIFSRLESPTATIGWPLTSPSGEGPIINLPEVFFSQGEDQYVWPAELASRARLFRPRLEELNLGSFSEFGKLGGPWLFESIIEDLWRKDISLFLLNREPPIDALFLTLPGLARVSKRTFGAYSSVQFEGLRLEGAERAAELLSNYYIFLDEILAELWAGLSEPKLMVVVSAHGMSAPKGWRELVRLLSRRSALEGEVTGAPDGALLMLGNDVARGVSLDQANLVDLMPTLLYGMGYPVARDLEGEVLNAAFRDEFKVRQPLTFLPSYEALE